jgi:serine/threonine-protein kinase haspin
MPLRHVYGKRSRAIYDPLAAFASPQRTNVNLIDDRQEPATTKSKAFDRTVRNGEKANKTTGARKALGDINANEVVKPMHPLNGQSKNKRTHRRKIVVEDIEEEHEQKEEVRGDIIPAPMHKINPLHPHPATQEDMQEAPIDEVDDVPLFCDGHGYDTDDEEPTQPMKKPGMSHEYLHITPERSPQRSPELSPQHTPSISILPPTPPLQDEYAEHCAELLGLSSHSMGDFSEWANELSSHFNIIKIAEASFGEVYRLSLLQQISGFSSNDESVFKVIALKPPDSRLPTDKRKITAATKTENMSNPTDVANEVRLLQRMTDVPGFTNFREVRVVKGRPPQPFIKAFRAFNATQKAKKKDLSVFPGPAKKASYAEDQLWAVIEMQDAGTDLEILVENGDCTSICFAWDAFWQVALSLAKGEEAAEFEHRDLHLGNICVHQPETSNDQNMNIDTRRKLNFTGLETTIIDYTISRAIMQDSTTAYKDLSTDSAIFEGDSTEEYQYEIYRYMRSTIFLDDPLADFPQTLPSSARERSWEQYHSVTNLIWLHYILYKLLEQVAWPSATKPPPRANKEEHARWKRTNDLEHVLLRVQDHLDPGSVFDNDLRSAGDLVLHAVSEGWLDQADVVGEGRWDEGEVEEALAAQFQDLGLQAKAVDGTIEADASSTKSRSQTRTRRKKG